jgi:hypothetical protein
MMNWKKTALWAGVTIVALFVIVIAMIKILVSPESVASEITPRLEKIFECPVQVGETELTIFSGIGVRIHDIGVKNQPPFADVPLATVSEIHARLKFFPLLLGNVRLKEIDIVGGQLYVVKDSAGANNLSALSLERLRQASEVEDESKLICRKIRIQDGRLLFRNDSTGTSLVLGKVDASLDFGTGAQPRIDTELRIDSVFLWSKTGNFLISPNAGELSLQGSYALASDSLIVNRCDWRIDKFAGRLEGAVARPAGDPYFNIHLMSEHTDLVDCYDSRIIAAIPVLRDMELAGDVRLDISLRGAFRDSRTTTVRGKVLVTGAAAKLPHDEMNLKAKLVQCDFNEASLSLFTEEAFLGSSPASVRIAVDNFREPTISGELRFSCATAVLGRLLQVDPNVRLGGDVSVTLSGFVKSTDREQSRLFGSVALNDLSYSDPKTGSSIDALSIDLNLNGNDADLTRCDLTLDGYRLQINGKLADFAPYIASERKPQRRPHFDFACTADSFSLGLLTKGHSGNNDTTAVLRLLDFFADFDSRGSLRVGNGLVAGLACRDLQAAVSVVNRIISTDTLSGYLFDRPIQADVVVDLNDLLQPEFDLDYSAEKIEANDFLSQLTNFSEHLYGRADLQASFEGKGLLKDQILRTLKANGKVIMEDGHLVSLPVASVLAGTFGIAALPDDEFDDLQARFTVENRFLQLNPLSIKKGKLVYQIEGAIDFDGGFDCRATRILSKDDARTLMERPDVIGLATSSNPGKAIFRLTGGADTAFVQLEALLPKD